MSTYTGLVIVFAVMVGLAIGFFLYKFMFKKMTKDPQEGGKPIDTLKSEGDDQPKKEAELPIEGKAEVLGQPAASSNTDEIKVDIKHHEDYNNS